MASANDLSQNATIDDEMKSLISKAADLVLNCNAILFTSGAGMGVGSGLGTFRGVAAGVWPPLLKHRNLDFTDMSNPSWFCKPEGNTVDHNTANFGYAFWAYRYNAYASSEPHIGYKIAKQWSEMDHVKHSFSFTSNIDGHWIRSGWNESSIYECHGSIHYMQCVEQCSEDIWETNDALQLEVDPKTDCAIGPLPKCRNCQKLARPNVLMFGDYGFVPNRSDEQMDNYNKFFKNLSEDCRILIIELGAGTAVPTVRQESQAIFKDSKWAADFIRINPLKEHATIHSSYKQNPKKQTIELTLDALTALTLINNEIMKKKFN